MEIKTKFNIGDIVYLKTDLEQLPRIIYGIKITMTNVCYIVAQGINTSEHYDIELQKQEDLIIKFKYDGYSDRNDN